MVMVIDKLSVISFIRTLKHLKFQNSWTCKLIQVLLLSTSITSIAWAGSIAVVTQEGSVVKTMTREEAADLFLGKRKIAIEGLSLIPVDIADEDLRDNFYQLVADMSAVRVNAYWARIVFSAQGRPPKKLMPDEAKVLANTQPGTITYIPQNEASGFNLLLNLP